jgi:hypothetical protein
VLETALQQGIVPAIVVAIYLIITKIIDNKKEDNQIKLNSDLVNSINNISKFIIDLTAHTINTDKDKCKNAIEDSMCASGMRLINFVSSTIINNHIDTNKDTILANIHNIINSEFYSVYSTLSLFNVNSKFISDYLDKSWMEVIEKDMIDIVYNTDLNKEDKILSFSNKLNIKFQSYITYILNNAF